MSHFLPLGKFFPCPGPSSVPLHRPPRKPALEAERMARRLTGGCPHPCQLLVLLLQLPFQLPQMFLNVAMTFLSLGAGTVSHLGDLCSFCSGPICHIPWCQGGLGDQGHRCHKNRALAYHLGAELLSPFPISFLLRANFKTYAHWIFTRSKGTVRGRCESTIGCHMLASLWLLLYYQTSPCGRFSLPGHHL